MKSLCVLDWGELQIFRTVIKIRYDEKYNIMYYKEQNYKEIYFMDLSIYIYKFRVSNIFIVNTKNVINNFEIEGGESGGKLGRCKVRRRLNLSTRIIERNWISNLRPLFVPPCIILYRSTLPDLSKFQIRNIVFPRPLS